MGKEKLQSIVVGGGTTTAALLWRKDVNDNFLGKGSHDSIYRATLDGGKLIAGAASCTGCGNCTDSAKNEIEILSRVYSPRCFVNLIVVEYILNGFVHKLLYSPVRPLGCTT
ncbi:hypothetical protein PIB30_027188 [Stylosanthes scabra]|uniref:Uncharacterized protein n=1 Tax=Stylosanthes scabra TaxID=79078 RepID=A0ABU6RAV2_9FABA|nr:hypothetical protein [Stylosanthes scabra]